MEGPERKGWLDQRRWPASTSIACVWESQEKPHPVVERNYQNNKAHTVQARTQGGPRGQHCSFSSFPGPFPSPGVPGSLRELLVSDTSEPLQVQFPLSGRPLTSDLLGKFFASSLQTSLRGLPGHLQAELKDPLMVLHWHGPLLHPF